MKKIATAESIPRRRATACLQFSRISSRSLSSMRSRSQKSLKLGTEGRGPTILRFQLPFHTSYTSLIEPARVAESAKTLCGPRCTKRATSRSKLSLEAEKFSKDKRMVSCLVRPRSDRGRRFFC